MKRLFITSFVALFTLGITAQENMEALSHLSVGVEAGLHGFGIEAAMPVHKSLVVKAGVNFLPGDLFSTDLSLDTEELKNAQEDLEKNGGKHFDHKFGDEAIINAGLGLGLTNLKLMVNWYPFEKRRLYLAGGFYYSLNDDPFIKISGQTTDNDWAALQELQAMDPNGDHELGLEVGGQKYSVIEKDGCGYMQADLRMAPLKYYLGLGLGRGIPNNRIGLQFELGAMIYSNATFFCQDKEITKEGLSEQFGESVEQIFDFMDQYPIYPQLTIRLNFRAF
jgi:hypothetical protein